MSETPATQTNWNVPNALTILRILLVPLFGWLLLVDGGEDQSMRVWAFVVFTIAIATDKLDGDLARKHNIVTDFGKLMDPIADKALTGMAFIGLSIIGELWWWVTIVVLGREWSITLLRFWIIKYGVMPASRGGKAKTLVQTLAIGVYLLPLPDAVMPFAVALMALAVLLTVGTGIDYVVQAARLRAGVRTEAQHHRDDQHQPNPRVARSPMARSAFGGGNLEDAQRQCRQRRAGVELDDDGRLGERGEIDGEPLRGSDLGPASAETTFTVSNYVSAGTPLRMT